MESNKGFFRGPSVSLMIRKRTASIEWKPPKTSELTCDQWSLFEPSAESKAELPTEILSYCRKEKNNVYKMCFTKCIIV